MLKTESPSDTHRDLDLYDTEALVQAFIGDQAQALAAVRNAAPALRAAVDAAVPRIAAGGRLVYVGAGTSGRLGVLDSVELYPTFSWPRERARALIAGGESAMFEAVEGAEDSREQGAADLAALQVGVHDVVILLAASGTTPYVMGALDAARAAGALTIGISNNAGAPVAGQAQLGITLNTGSEIISGSTRLKAGTSQKIALNTLSSAIMVKLNKVYGNLMVDVHPTNAKLYRRAVHLTMRATGADEETARRTLQACDFSVKVAIVAILAGVDVEQAAGRLARTQGSVRMALAGSGVHHPPQEPAMKEDKPSAKATPDLEGRESRGSVNRDPITGAPGAHPVGVGLGAAAAGAAVGAATGTLAGPLGTVVGTAIGAVVGGLAGKTVAELVDPTVEDFYWREHYQQRPYVPEGAGFEDYGPAYRYGLKAYTEEPGRSFDDREASLQAGWAAARGSSRLDWNDARHAARDAWHRTEDLVGRSSADEDLPE